MKEKINCTIGNVKLEFSVELKIKEAENIKIKKITGKTLEELFINLCEETDSYQDKIIYNIENSNKSASPDDIVDYLINQMTNIRNKGF